jgi:four helix bundle protein
VAGGKQPASQDLQVWRKALDWTEAIYRSSRSWPSDERFGLISQVRRAAVSVAANIAEGAARRTTGEFLQFIGIAKGSLAEAETLLLLTERPDYTSEPDLRARFEEADQIGKMLSGLAASLQTGRDD